MQGIVLTGMQVIGLGKARGGGGGGGCNVLHKIWDFTNQLLGRRVRYSLSSHSFPASLKTMHYAVTMTRSSNISVRFPGSEINLKL